MTAVFTIAAGFLGLATALVSLVLGGSFATAFLLWTSVGLAATLLGLAWSPCIGPTMGAAVALASTGQNLTWSFLIMVFYGAGLVTILTLLAYGGRSVIQRRKALLTRIAAHAPRIMGATLLLVGLALTFKLHIAAEIWLLDHLPDSFISLSTRL